MQPRVHLLPSMRADFLHSVSRDCENVKRSIKGGVQELVSSSKLPLQGGKDSFSSLFLTRCFLYNLQNKSFLLKLQKMEGSEEVMIFAADNISYKSDIKVIHCRNFNGSMQSTSDDILQSDSAPAPSLCHT